MNHARVSVHDIIFETHLDAILEGMHFSRCAAPFFFHGLNSSSEYSMSSQTTAWDIGHMVQTRVPRASCVPASHGEPALFTTSLIYLSNMHHTVPRQTTMCCVKLRCSLVLQPV